MASLALDAQGHRGKDEPPLDKSLLEFQVLQNMTDREHRPRREAPPKRTTHAPRSLKMSNNPKMFSRTYIWVVIELTTISYLIPKGYLSKNLQNL